VKQPDKLKPQVTQENKNLLNVYKEMTVLTLDDIQRIKKPSKLAFDACRLLCLFINTFREKDNQWPKESFQGWVTVHHFLISSPNVARIVKEVL